MAALNYHHLRYFRAVAHEGRLTRAAERMNVSQSALSKQIRQLEESLGQALFEREGRALRLTEAGRIALDHADAIFETGEELVSTLKHAGHARRPLRVGAMSTLSRNFQISFLRPVLRRPDIEVVLRSGGSVELLEALSTLQVDLVLTNRPPDGSALTPYIVHRIAEQAVALVGVPELCPPGLGLAERLASAPLILPTQLSGPRSGFDALVSRLGVTVEVAAEVDDMAMMRLLAREGAGLAVLPPIVVRDELDAGTLVGAGDLPGITETFFAVSTRRRYPNPLIRLLLNQEASPQAFDQAADSGPA
jgi:LysR family transcriptional activator of nhaA